MIELLKNGGGVQMLSYKPPPKCTDAGRWEDMIYNMLPRAGGDLPKGVIVMWSGAVDAVPDSWALCDGTNGTPDLRGRFALGAGSSYAVGSSGGEEKHTLTANELPVHTHGLPIHVSGTNVHELTVLEGHRYDVAGTGHPETSVRFYPGGPTGGNQPHNNMPPYYALAYIMKL